MTDLLKPTAEVEVRPCPFCQCDQLGNLFGRSFACQNCGAIVPKHVWNSRPLEEAAAHREAGLREALKDLVHANEEWNAAVEKIVGRPNGWTDAYLDKARAALETSR